VPSIVMKGSCCSAAHSVSAQVTGMPETVLTCTTEVSSDSMALAR
jgi:hypothetical protein